MQERIEGNRLSAETSPYLLQHKDNPVHWRAWGPAALAEAKATGKPILLSVGYAACHWCHVMAHESFEDEATAAVMNELFVNIKVDREERPDVDAIYMGALHELGEQGGWPLTMFLTSDAEPFWGGTYFPKEARYGRPSFVRVLNEVARIYRDEQDKVRQNADVLKDRLKPQRRHDAGAPPPRGDARRACAAAGAGGRSDAWRHQGRAEISRSRSSSAAVARGPPLRAAASARGGRPHADADRARRHLRSSRRRLRALQRRRALARAAFREDALRQRAARRADDRGLARAEVAALCAARRRDHRLARCARWWSRAAALPRRSTPTAKARRASSMCGRSPRSSGVLGETDAGVFAEIYDVTAQGNFEGHNILNRLDCDRAARRRDRGAARSDAREAARAARSARAPGLRRQGARRLERADDRRARQRGATRSTAPTGSRRRSAPSISSVHG